VSGTILCAREKAIATVTLSNPGKLNAMDFAMWQQLARTFNDLSADDRVRCVVLRGDGEQAFAAGGDIGEFLTRRDTLEHALIYHGQAGAALQAVFNCRHPTIALVQGACIGGGLEIAAQCDLRICGESSRFGVPIGRLGFSMYPAEMEGLLRLAGPATVRRNPARRSNSRLVRGPGKRSAHPRRR
jgi:enoyl-CoA hydratase